MFSGLFVGDGGLVCGLGVCVVWVIAACVVIESCVGGEWLVSDW